MVYFRKKANEYIVLYQGIKWSRKWKEENKIMFEGFFALCNVTFSR